MALWKKFTQRTPNCRWRLFYNSGAISWTPSSFSTQTRWFARLGDVNVCGHAPAHTQCVLGECALLCWQVLYCDLRPRNVLVDEFGVLKLSNFEGARQVQSSSAKLWLPLKEALLLQEQQRPHAHFLAPELFSLTPSTDGSGRCVPWVLYCRKDRVVALWSFHSI